MDNNAKNWSGVEKDMEHQKIENQIDELRKDISAIAKSLKKIGSEKLRRTKHAVENLLDGAREQGEGTLDDAQQKLYDMQNDMIENIREKPFTSIAVAASVGFILAHLLRR